ncbi:cornifelin homolog [Saccoglossus kowalevskii]|uniref:Placenta-specific gene 8 protein-like n=1 Tax=Saccoglossus kowalevskii TaxID=10224 RepID=A0ABM0GKA9_SACKO|nr:PREDICTED: placenta-specific gene 8 protein-like [Saccoglossus kowalevskii]
MAYTPQMDAPMYTPYPDQQQGPIQQQPAPMQHTSHNTTVVVQQQPQNIIVQGPRDWSSDLCACFNDLSSCCLGTFFPLCFEMHLWNRMGENACGPCCIVNSASMLRVKIRTKQNIQGTLCGDYCITAFCYQCVLCQLSREVDFVERTGMDGGSPMSATGTTHTIIQ